MCIPPGVYNRLKDSAQGSGRSLSAEVLALAETGLAKSAMSPPSVTNGISNECYRRVIRAIFEGSKPHPDDCLAIAIDLGVDHFELRMMLMGVEASFDA